MEPPRGRGKVIVYITAWRVAGITPAWAGKRAWRSVKTALCWDHPRMGGEKGTLPLLVCWWAGSPPRRRGKEVRANVATLGRGITPAWAGKRTLHRFHRLACRDHPRMGGEKAQVLPAGISSEGSPPRGRGKGVSNVLVPEKFGITPAWAGKSRYRCRCWSGGRDHPRVGGEKGTVKLMVVAPWGSPPHGRGKAFQARSEHSHDRITPAWAGKRTRCQTSGPLHQDHPRMGGEKCCRNCASFPS